MSKLTGREAEPSRLQATDRGLGELAHVAWPHIAKLLSFGGLVALLLTRPHAYDPATDQASDGPVVATVGDPTAVLAFDDLSTSETISTIVELHMSTGQTVLSAYEASATTWA